MANITLPCKFKSFLSLPQIHELWCLGLYNIGRKFHPRASVEVTAGTVVEFVTKYFATNRLRIHIMRQFFVNDIIQFSVVPGQGGGSGLLFIYNLHVPLKATGWESANNSNQKLGGSTFDADSITNVAWDEPRRPLSGLLVAESW